MNTMITNVLSKASVIAGKSALKLRAAGPTIAIVGGIGCGVVATVWACKQTLKLEETMQPTKEKLMEIKSTMEEIYEDDMTPAELKENITYAKKDLTKTYFTGAWDIAKLYAGPVALGITSLALISGSHIVLNRRLAASSATIQALTEALKAPNANIKRELDEHEVKYREVTKDGDEVLSNASDHIDSVGSYSPYARIFDESCVGVWQKDAGTNLFCLRTAEKMLTQKLQSRGYLFLNEAYEALGMSPRKEGQVVGWMLGKGDDYVDFGLNDWEAHPGAEHFVKGEERSVVVDFNVDGCILDNFEQNVGYITG